MRVAINGFGRIGRLVLRAAMLRKNGDGHLGSGTGPYRTGDSHQPLAGNSPLEWVAVNDLTDAKTLAYLFQYDSTFGKYPGEVGAKDSSLVVDGKEIEVLAEKEPVKLPWKDLGIDLVIESTGRFTDAEKAKGHLDAGAGTVVISAPAKGEDITICMGINEDLYHPEKHRIISNASCTTNCLAPLVKVLHENFKVKRGLMTTIHSYTNDQVILDFPHKDLRRARAAGLSLIPTTTGAAQAIGLVIPELQGKLNGVAIRVPTPNVSLTDFVAEVEQPATKEGVNSAFKKAAASKPLAGYLQYCEEPLVSKDFNGNSASCIFDSAQTDVMDKTLVKVFGWYDNEWGYANRVVDLALYIASRKPILSY